MGKIYAGQDVKVRLTVGQDITGASVKKIKYRKPGGTEGSWNATVEDAENGIIYYDVQDEDIDESGVWTFWAYITFADGRSAPGESITRNFYREGT